MDFRLWKFTAGLFAGILCACAGTVFTPQTAEAQLIRPLAGRENTIIDDSRRVLEEIMEIPASGIPTWLFEKAEAVAVFPGLVKGSFIVGAQHGKGVLIVKNEEGKWDAPRFVKLTGGSVGFQAGIQSADIILVFCTRRSVNSAIKGQFTMGVDASVAAGPIGRQASASTDVQLSSEIYSYSRSRGIFLGAALDGCAMEVDEDVSKQFYANGLPENAASLVRMVAGYVNQTPNDGTPGENTSAGNSSLPPKDAPLRNAQEEMRLQLVQAHAQLMQLLEPEWQTWLALPPSVVTGSKTAGNPAVSAPSAAPESPASPQVSPSAAPQSVSSAFPELLTLQERFHRLKNDPKYAELAAKTEFQQTLLLLDQYLLQ